MKMPSLKVALMCFLGSARTTVAATSRAQAQLSMEAGTEMQMSMEALAHRMLRMDNSGPSVSDAIRSTSERMDLKTAAHRVHQRHLPHEVTVLVEAAAEGNAKQPFSEESMEKARLVLNQMVENAWRELDDKIIECKEYEEQNRGTYEQVSSDLSRLVEQITDLSRIESEAIENINHKEQEILDVEGELALESKNYKTTRAENDAELTVRQNDLDVFTFILDFTKCADATSLVQRSARICQTQNGENALHLGDRKLQARYEHILSQSSRRIMSDLLGEVHQGRQRHHEKRPVSFLQDEQEPDSDTIAVNELPVAIDETPVKGEDGPANPEVMGMSCSPAPPDCGLLHDKLSLMWGDYKDKVDELTMQMSQNEFEYEELKMNLNEQIRLLTTSKGRFSMQLSEARSNLAGDRSEKKAKESQKIDLDKAYYEEMENCKKRITWIMYQDMCALIVVRNAVLADSSTCPAASINDCDVDAWIPDECSVPCDDNCPDANDPYACGGWQQVQRKVVVAPDSCGLQCPDLSRSKKCNQVKCPVDCAMSEWSGWSKCTADCEGGVQGHTRSILERPQNGGESCNTVEETRPCNTDSCDRDCTLTRFTAWGPCSAACGGGFQERFKHVLIPTRGYGKCPTKESWERFRKKECNTHSCVGDEICIANQDLLIAIDGSGSLGEEGFAALKGFAVDLVNRYQGEYFGMGAMQVGVILFGNGVIMADDNTVSPAINEQGLTSDMAVVKSAIEGLPYKKGFTNMAQAFALAEKMYTAASRKGAQQALLVISDGKPSFAFQTSELVQQLDDRGVQRFFVVVSDSQDDLNQMKQWASVPWETNLLHVPGVEILQADAAVFAEKALTTFCPMSFSSSQLAIEEESKGFMHVKDGGYCGERGALLSRDAEGDTACAFLAQGFGAQAFLLGTWFRTGYCYASSMTVDAGQYSTWESTRIAPGCASGWVNSRIFDFYALEPVASL